MGTAVWGRGPIGARPECQQRPLRDGEQVAVAGRKHGPQLGTSVRHRSQCGQSRWPDADGGVTGGWTQRQGVWINSSKDFGFCSKSAGKALESLLPQSELRWRFQITCCCVSWPG